MAIAMRLSLAALAGAVAFLAHAADPLFPAPLHLTREVHDPITGTTALLDEYAYGNRLVSVRGAKTSIADYERGELTEIDRDAGTYSITAFDRIARAYAATGGGEDAAPVQLRSAGVRTTRLGREAELFEAELPPKPMKRTVTVAVDDRTTLSKEALEVLVGAAYPSSRRAEHDVIVTVAARDRRGDGVTTNALSSSQSYALPIEQSLIVELDGQRLEMRTSVVRVGPERPAAELLSIPAGARLVTAHIVAIQNELEQLDRPPAHRTSTTPP
jgi:hypothetical protein